MIFLHFPQNEILIRPSPISMLRTFSHLFLFLLSRPEPRRELLMQESPGY